MEFDAKGQQETETSIELTRVGTCMAWQWMCPTGCGYVLGINADRAQITESAARHLRWHRIT